MNSSDFDPKQTITYAWLKNAFPALPNAETTSRPNEYDNAILIVNAAGNLQIETKSQPWKSELDDVAISKDVGYNLIAEGVLKKESTAVWHGKDMQLTIDCPKGILGTLLVHFSDLNNNQRTGLLEFEGRKSKLGSYQGDGSWVKFHIMREDSNDGKLILKAKSETESSLMISKVVLLQE